jgi:NADPH:quinone reductase-like Zn-dependent oxidoreductase
MMEARPRMKAVRIHDYGGTDVLVVEEAPRPQADKGQVLVRMLAAGVNPADSGYRSGAYSQFMTLQFPWTPGLEGAGIVESVGADVNAFQAGQEVYGFVAGGYAQYALAKENDLQSKPSNLSMEEAAAVPMGATMAWAALIDTAKVEEGQSVLIHGAAGGIGSYATQLAHWKKAYVIGTTSKENLTFVRSLGAQMAADYRETPFEAVVHDVDVVIDTVGGEVLRRSWSVVRPGGALITVAGRISPEAGSAHGIRAASVMRPPFANYEQISELLASRTLVPTIRQMFPLAEARAAQQLSETKHGRGRIVLKIP